MIALPLLIALAAAPPPPSASAAPAADEIVVEAKRGACRIRLANETLSMHDLDVHAREWAAGRPLRVVEPRGARLPCLSKIAFRLADHGVKLIEFVDAPDP